MDNNILSTIRTAKGFNRSVAMLITLALLGVMLERTLYYTLNENDIIEDENVVERIQRMAPHKAKQLGLSQQTQNQNKIQKQTKSDETKLANTVQNIKEKLAAIDNPYETVNTKQLVEDITALRKNLDGLNKKVKQNFETTRQHIEDKNLPDIILQRHADTVAEYDEKFKTLQHKLLAIDLASTLEDKQRKLKDAKAWLSQQQFKRSQQAFDPNNLPFKSAKPNPENKPKLSKESFTENGFFNTPNIQLAALGDFTYANLPGAGNPAYRTATDEILLTQPIKDQAALLNHDPVQIYHWVRNNIEWQPTWGAVQDAELTLDAKRGNAMDIASLTLALLRASLIPARYVHGTIEIPEAEFRNWAGGFSSIDAAVDFAASGGIPTAAVIRGGKIDTVQIEHIWVEIAADYHPSRVAKNIDADSWVQIDPSFKQYTYLNGLDVVQISEIDTNQLAQDVLNSGTINEAEGWVTGFDPTILQAAQAQAQTALESHITNNMTNPTVGDVIGGRKTIIEQHPTLASSLPNNIIVTGTRYDKLPSNLQQSVSYTFLQNTSSQINTPVSFAWSTVNNEKVTLSFKPATAADEAALQSLLPGGQITDISQLPSSIPAYLINVVPELKVNGVLQMIGTSMSLGEELKFKTNIVHPGRSSQINYVYKIPAGSFVSVNTVAGNVSSVKLSWLQMQLNKTKATLATNDSNLIQNLKNEDIWGDLFYTGTLGYFIQLIGFNRVSALKADSQYYLSAGYGIFGYEPKVNYFFGIPQSVEQGGVSLDIPLNIVTAENNNNKEKEIKFKLKSGVISSVLEYATPEQLFSRNAPNAFSAIKAIKIATSEGQKIYQINSNNIDVVFPRLNLDSNTESEIQQSVNLGKEVITHTDIVSVPGYSGAGYIIIDPSTGDGSYKIGGGSNGGFVFAFVMTVIAFFLAIKLLLAGTILALLGGLMLTIFEGISTLLWLNSISNAKTKDDFNKANASQFITGLMAAIPFARFSGPLSKAGAISTAAWAWFFGLP